MIATLIVSAIALAVEPEALPPFDAPSSPRPPPQLPSAPQKCFRPQSSYRATTTGEVVSTAVAGTYMVALRYGRYLPNEVKMFHTDLGNWTIAIGRIGCRTVTMFEGFHGLGKVDQHGVIHWQDPKDVWKPELTWCEWLLSFLPVLTDIDAADEQYEREDFGEFEEENYYYTEPHVLENMEEEYDALSYDTVENV